MARTASKSTKASKAAKPKVVKAPKEKVVKARDPLRYNVGPAQNHFFHGQVFVVVSDETRKRYAEATGTQASTNRNNPNYRQGAEFAKRLENPLYANEVLVLDINRENTVINPDDGSVRHRVVLNITGDINDVIASITNFMVYMRKHTAAGNGKSDEELFASARETVLELLRDPKITVSKQYLDSSDPNIKAAQLAILNEYRKNAEAHKARNIFPYDIEMLNNIRISNKSSAEISKRDKKPKKSAVAATAAEPGKKRGPMPLLLKIKKQVANGKNEVISLVKFGVSGAAGRPKSLTWVPADKTVAHPKVEAFNLTWIISEDRDLQAFIDQLSAENQEGSERYQIATSLIHALTNAWAEYKRTHQVAVPSQSVAPPPAAVVSPLVAVSPSQLADLSQTPKAPSFLAVNNLLAAPAPTPTPSPISAKIGLSTAATPVSVSSDNSLTALGFFDRGGAIPTTVAPTAQLNIPGITSVQQPTVKPSATPLFQVAPAPTPVAPTPIAATPVVAPTQAPILEYKEGLANAQPSTQFNPSAFTMSNFFAANVATPGK